MPCCWKYDFSAAWLALVVRSVVIRSISASWSAVKVTLAGASSLPPVALQPVACHHYPDPRQRVQPIVAG